MTPANMVCAHRALQALGAREVRNVTAGHVFVVAVATLVGGLLCTFEHVLSDGTHTQGVALKLRRGFVDASLHLYLSSDADPIGNQFDDVARGCNQQPAWLQNKMALVSG